VTESVMTALIGFSIVFGGAMAGMAANILWPGPLSCGETKDVVRGATGMLSLLAALVLGLLLSSAKNSFDTKTREVQEFAANLALLGSVLHDYGPEAKPAWVLMREATLAKVHLMWPNDSRNMPVMFDPRLVGKFEAVQGMVLALTPQSNAQQWLQSRALQIVAEIDHERWLIGAQSGSSIQPPFLYILLCWITALFFSFGLFARVNTITFLALLICAASISAAVLLILDLDSPFAGLITISPQPILHALAMAAEVVPP